MLRRFPFAAWITLSAALVAAGASIRFDGTYRVSDQLVLGMLFFVAAFMLTVALICWLPLLRRLPDARSTGRIVILFVLAPALSMGLLASMAFESKEAAAARHRAHLLRVAQIIVEDYNQRGRMPVLLDDALERSRTPLPHRGDANGRSITYQKLDSDNSLICAPSCRVHIEIEATQIRYLTWPEGHPDPCGNRSDSSYWSGSDPDRTGPTNLTRPPVTNPGPQQSEDHVETIREAAIRNDGRPPDRFFGHVEHLNASRLLQGVNCGRVVRFTCDFLHIFHVRDRPVRVDNEQSSRQQRYRHAGH